MTATILDPTAVVAGPTPSARVWKWFGRYGALLVLAILVIGTSILEPSTFATYDNFINILNQSALSAIIAMGLTFALVTGEFDLSIGNVASLAGVVGLTAMVDKDFSIPAALLLAVVIGAVVGLLNGLVVTLLNVNALVATLGIGTVAVGVNYAVAGGTPVGLPDPGSFIQLTLGRFLGIPYPVFMMLGLAAVLWFILNRTVVGQSMQAVGGNPVAAQLSGIRVDRVKMFAFATAGVCAALTTTIAGLIVAIPAVFGYNYLLNQVKGLITELENYASSLADRIELETAGTVAQTPTSSQQD